MKASEIKFEVGMEYLMPNGDGDPAVVEATSPPLAGEEGLAEVAYMAITADENGATVNGKCAFRVSVDLSTLNRSQVRKVRKALRRYSKVLDVLNFGLEVTPVVKAKTLQATFAGTLDVERIVTILYACVGLVAYAANARKVSKRGIPDRANACRTFIEIWEPADHRIIPDESATGACDFLIAQARNMVGE